MSKRTDAEAAVRAGFIVDGDRLDEILRGRARPAERAERAAPPKTEDDDGEQA